MAKYSINAGYSDAKNLEAHEFELQGDYWFFYDAKGRAVYVRAAKNVSTITEIQAN